MGSNEYIIDCGLAFANLLVIIPMFEPISKISPLLGNKLTKWKK
jgi:hypothetical protein